MKIVTALTSFLDKIGHGVIKALSVVFKGLKTTTKKIIIKVSKKDDKFTTRVRDFFTQTLKVVNKYAKIAGQYFIIFLDWLGRLIISFISWIVNKIRHGRFRKTKFVQILGKAWKRRHHKNRPVVWAAVFILIVFSPIAILTLKSPKDTVEAAWFNDGWLYRKKAAITNAGSAQTDYQVAVTLDTATLITAGKMQSDCDDIRVTDHKGRILPHWTEDSGAYACNDSDTKIWAKVPSLPTSGALIYVYYGNSSTHSIDNGNETFEFFDDFSASAIDDTKWSQGTIAATSGTNFSQASGLLSDGNNNRYIQSTAAFTGNYAATTRVYTTTSANNGYSTVGFWASTSNNFGILDHNGTTYIRNDSNWPNYTYNGTGQWNRDEVRVAGTSATHWRTGETSGSTTAGNTNSGLSSEYVRLGARYDSSAYDQNFVADWDWIFVRKTAATEPSTGTPGTEEVSPGPVAHWKFDEGYGTTANDSTSNANNGTIAGATWQSEDQCVSGKCLYFTNTNSINVTDPSNNSLDFGTGDFTISTWIKTGTSADNRNLFRKGAGDGTYGWRFGLSSGVPNVLIGDSSNANGNLGSTSIADNKWHHLSVVYDRSGNATGYVDGKQVGALDISARSGDISNSSAVIIGNSYATFTGFLDEPKIYPYARTPAQIKTDYNSGTSGQGTAEGAATSFGADQQQNFLSDGLVGYWDMDESSANTCSGGVNDSCDGSGNGNDGAWNGNATSATGKFGSGGTFDGNADYVEIPDSTSISTTDSSDAITVSAWVYQTAQTNYDRILSSNWATDGSWLLSVNSSYKPNFVIKASGAQYTAADADTISTNAWHHIVGTYDGEYVRLYVDGEAQTPIACSGCDLDNAGSVLRISEAGSTEGFAGKVDEVRIYNRALSPTEVRKLYNWAPGPTTHYKFDGNANDASGSNLNFTTTKSYTPGKFGKALVFEGGTAGTTASTNILDTDTHTIEFWIQFTGYTSGWQGIFNYKPSGSDRSPGIWRHTSGRMLHWRYDAGNTGTDVYLDGVGSGAQFSDNTWYHVAGTKEGSTFKAYVNGNYVGSVSVANPKYSGSSPFYFGSAEVNIDDFRTYNYARTSGQIIEDMNAGHPIGGSPISSKIGHWRFDEGYGSTTYNLGTLGSSQDGTITAATWNNSGKFGKSLTFDGSTTVVKVPTFSYESSNQYTLSFWAYYTGGQGTYLVKETSWNNGFKFWGGLSSLYFRAGDGTDAADLFSAVNTGASSSTWNHIAVVRDGSTWYLYTNGVLTTSATNSAIDETNNSGQLKIGNREEVSWDPEFQGKLDEVKIYNTALTPDQIKLDMNQGASTVLGATGTDASGNASWSSERSYCPPGDTTASCAPVGEWKFDEKTGTTAQDTSGNGNNSSSFTGSPAWTQGKVGAALDFGTESETKYVTVADNNQLDIGTSDYTIEAWIKHGANLGSSWDAGIVDKYNGTSGYAFTVRTNSDPSNAGKLNFIVRDNPSTWVEVKSTSTVNDGQWHHVVASADRDTNVKIYIDGVLDQTSSAITTQQGSVAGTDDVIIGRLNSNFNGKIDHVKIYNYARTPAQVAYDYNRGKPIGHWKLDECQGTTAYDSSGNENNGTITIGGTGSNTSAGTCSSGTGTEAWNNGTTGKLNYSLDFDGTDDYISLTDAPEFDVKKMTISAWIKTSKTSTQYISERNNATYYFATGVSSQKLCIYINSVAASWDCSNASVTDGNWHHVISTWDGTNKKLYIDGILDSTFAGSGGDISASTEAINIGVRITLGTPSGYFDGQIDDVQIFNYALNSTQVKTLYNGSAIRFGPSEGSP